jgi:hypothetical protein
MANSKISIQTIKDNAKALQLKFITGIHCARSQLEALNNMTFIYDVNWNPSNSKRATLPVCFFHVKSQHEMMSSEVSQKQMLFYNSSLGKTSADPALDSGLLNVVADNIVIKPKIYKLDVVVPYKNLTLLNQSFNQNSFTQQAVTEFLLGGKYKGVGFDKNLASWLTTSQPYTQLIKTLLSTLEYKDYSDDTFGSWLSGIVQSPDYNKESLEVMWRMRHIVKMKTWHDWRYKYLSIVDIDITKEGTEDGVYEATLTLQEMPIISMYPSSMKTVNTFTRKNALLSARGKTAIAILDTAGIGFGQE